MELKLFPSPLSKRPAVGYAWAGADCPIIFIGEDGVARLALSSHAPIAHDGYGKVRFIKGAPPKNGIKSAGDGDNHQMVKWHDISFHLEDSPADHSCDLYIHKGGLTSFLLQIRPEGIYRYNIYWDWPFMTSDVHGNKKIAVLR